MSYRTAGGAMTLEGKYYTSESIYHLESERIFSERWLYVGRRFQLAEAGRYFLYDVDRESIIILQDHEGEVQAFHNLCRHRGTRICHTAEGKFSRSIQCPYHAWTYGLDGRLIGAPTMQETKNFRKREHSLLAVATAVWEGGIFINLSPAPQPFTETFALIFDKFAPWHLHELTVVHRIDYLVEANWKLVLQNYSECYHCPTLHPHLNRLTPYRESTNDLEEGPFLGGPMRMTLKEGSMTLNGRRCAAPLGEVAGEELQKVYYYVIFPNLLLSLHPDYVLIHRVDRLGTARSRIVCEWLFHPQAAARDDFDPGPAIEFWNITNLQDWHVCELSQQGVASRAYRPGPYGELESMIAAFDREYRAALGYLQTKE